MRTVCHADGEWRFGRSLHSAVSKDSSCQAINVSLSNWGQIGCARALQSPGPSWCPGWTHGHVYWPAQLCRVWPQDLEPTTNGPPITRTVAHFIQAPAQDPLVCFSTRQCWLQLWVSCTVVPSALWWLYSEFGADSTPLNSVLWNMLPTSVRNTGLPLSRFRRQLKTFHFCAADLRDLAHSWPCRGRSSTTRAHANINFSN